jgi:hypothetical protein
VICPKCHGSRGHHEKILANVLSAGRETFFWVWLPCDECIGGVASCCDAAGSGTPNPLSRGEQLATKSCLAFLGALPPQGAQSSLRLTVDETQC